MSVKGPGASWLLKALGSPGHQLGAPGPPVHQLEAPGSQLGTPGLPGCQ